MQRKEMAVGVEIYGAKIEVEEASLSRPLLKQLRSVCEEQSFETSSNIFLFLENFH